jgi:uncharacterized repeat protein (TIGR03803 family)
MPIYKVVIAVGLLSGLVSLAQDSDIPAVRDNKPGLNATGTRPAKVRNALLAADNVLYNFGSKSQDGVNPQSGLVQASDGNFYGTTLRGGSHNNGTVFQYNPTTQIETVTHSFYGGTEGNLPIGTLIQATDGNLYGTTQTSGCNGGAPGGSVFRIGLGLSQTPTSIYCFQGLSNGAEPFAGVIQGTDGYLYGTTYQGGAISGGAVFKIDLNGNLQAQYNFPMSSTDRQNPASALVEVNDTFYGTTLAGGTANQGTIFAMDSTLTLVWEYSITSSDGIGTLEFSPLLFANGNLYGEAQTGGANSLGAIFEIDTNLKTLSAPSASSRTTILAKGRSLARDCPTPRRITARDF